MQKNNRQKYNAEFSEEKYQAFLEDLASTYNEKIDFRVAETPLFVSKQLKERLIEACEDIIKVIAADNFKELTDKAIPAHQFVPHEDAYPQFLTIDFAVCKDNEGELMPQLIEMQGFPSLYGFQILAAKTFQKHFSIPEDFTPFLNNFDESQYYGLLKRVILGKYQPENVILLEIEPHKQKTRIDFYCTRDKVGIEPICISDIIKEGRQLFYMLNGKKTPIYRIYNRLIFDEFEKRDDLVRQFNMIDDVDVEWAGHPNWFFRMSKYTVPFVHSKYVPSTHFLNELKEIPTDLENYVLKPLFSFAGAGVKFNVVPDDITQIPENQRHSYVLQRKVQYTSALHDHHDEPIKAEIRMLLLWEENTPKPIFVAGLGRLSKGVMIGVDFNKDKTWVGGTAIFFEK